MTEPLITDKLFSLINSMNYPNDGMTRDQRKQIKTLLESQVESDELSSFDCAQLYVRADGCYQRGESIMDYKQQIIKLLENFPRRMAYT